ncbi:MAG: hypothetical protein FWD12_11165 [Alphaproteobacteria bacterium]|nr:hypothetical protein [Alphaproteobacteria bacterium]
MTATREGFVMKRLANTVPAVIVVGAAPAVTLAARSMPTGIVTPAILAKPGSITGDKLALAAKGPLSLHFFPILKRAASDRAIAVTPRARPAGAGNARLPLWPLLSQRGRPARNHPI